jgi:hypothetical protein
MINQEEKRTIIKRINSWVKEIKDADHKDNTYFKGHTQLEFILSKVTDLLLLAERDDIPKFPKKRFSVWVGLTEDYPERLDNCRGGKS